jgi:thiamine kinase-like enzyme
VVVETLKQQAVDRAAELQRMQDAVAGGGSTLEQELTAALQVISQLETEMNNSRSQTDESRRLASSLEKQLENVNARCALFVCHELQLE